MRPRGRSRSRAAARRPRPDLTSTAGAPAHLLGQLGGEQDLPRACDEGGEGRTSRSTGTSTSHGTGDRLRRRQGLRAEPGQRSIGYANLDGSGAGLLNTAGATFAKPSGLAIDPAGGRIYWGNRRRLDRLRQPRTAAAGAGSKRQGRRRRPNGVAVDPADGRIYWTNFAANKISYATSTAAAAHDLDTGRPDRRPRRRRDRSQHRPDLLDQLERRLDRLRRLDGGGGRDAQSQPVRGETGRPRHRPVRRLLGERRLRHRSKPAISPCRALPLEYGGGHAEASPSPSSSEPRATPNPSGPGRTPGRVRPSPAHRATGGAT